METFGMSNERSWRVRYVPCYIYIIPYCISAVRSVFIWRLITNGEVEDRKRTKTLAVFNEHRSAGCELAAKSTGNTKTIVRRIVGNDLGKKKLCTRLVRRAPTTTATRFWRGRFDWNRHKHNSWKQFTGMTKIDISLLPRKQKAYSGPVKIRRNQNKM